MEKELIVRLREASSPDRPPIEVKAVLKATGASAQQRFAQRHEGPGPHLWLRGDRDYYVVLKTPAGGLDERTVAALQAQRGQQVLVIFPRRSPVKRVLAGLTGPAVDGQAAASAPAAAPAAAAEPRPAAAPAPSEAAKRVDGALDLTAGLPGAPALFLLQDGRFSRTPAPPAGGMDLLDPLATAARWVSTRRTTSFECLFPPSAFHPDEPSRPERLTPAQAEGLLGQLREALGAAAVDGPAARERPDEAAQLRSAVLTILSHLLATVLKDPAYRAAADAAAAEIFGLIDREQGDTARSSLRGHAIQLLSLRAPALGEADQGRARDLLRGLVREAPPYDELTGPWRFAMCSAWDFHEGECEILRDRYKFRELEVPADAPPPPSGRHYKVLEAPFKTPHGQPIQVFARSADPSDENHAMGHEYFTGLLINRHAQLGSFDMTAANVQVQQAGYKLMMNTQCAGLTTRFAISKVFPAADIYSSWDSTYFQTGQGGKVTASEGLDCFVAMLAGMEKREPHAKLEQRMAEKQWYHKQAQFPGFVQFVGPAHPDVVGRYQDVNQDGRADFYDGFLDFFVKALAEDLRESTTPRDPGVAPTQISGQAAQGLGWAAGSLNRVVQYSDLWDDLPGVSELFYPYRAAGFYSHREPPRDVPVGQTPVRHELGKLPSVCRYLKDPQAPGGMIVEVMFHSHLAHAAQELKRLLCAADALWRAFDLDLLPKQGLLATPLGQRGMLLLTMVGLLEFPADQNFIDGLWGMGCKMLAFPPISRSTVRACINQADHDASNYYGSVRGLKQLIGEDGSGGALKKADEVAFTKLNDGDPQVGRALELQLG